MTRWAKDATTFKVSLSENKNKNGSISKICRIPKPITESLDNPDSLLFKIDKNKVCIEAGSK